MTLSKITFVTAFIDIYKGERADRTTSWRFQKFLEIVETGVQICVFVDDIDAGLINEHMGIYSNIKLMKTIKFEDLWIETCIRDKHLFLPEVRCQVKDTPQYMSLINSKVEFLKRTVEENPWNSSHFAWIDFSLSYVFHNSESALKQLSYLGNECLFDASNRFLTVPGCIGKDTNYMERILHQPHWRFCGGFMLGDAASIMELVELYEIHFPEFIANYNTLVWEVNFWAWLEICRGWNPIWYYAGHDDSIINVPEMFLGQREIA